MGSPPLSLEKTNIARGGFHHSSQQSGNGGFHHMSANNPYYRYPQQIDWSEGQLYFPGYQQIYGQRAYGLKWGNADTSTISEPSGSYGLTSLAGNGQTGYGGYGPSGVNYNYNPHGALQTAPIKLKGSSVMTALTLLSFFFFINLLQSCLKEHMHAINPTVMVMTAGAGRLRVSLNKHQGSLDVSDSRELSPFTVDRNITKIYHSGYRSPLETTSDEDVEQNNMFEKVKVKIMRNDQNPPYWADKQDVYTNISFNMFSRNGTEIPQFYHPNGIKIKRKLQEGFLNNMLDNTAARKESFSTRIN